MTITNNNNSNHGSSKKQLTLCDLTYAYSRGGGITTYIDAKGQYFFRHDIRQIIITPRQDNKDGIIKEDHGKRVIYRLPSRIVMVDSLKYYFFRSYDDIEKIIKEEKPNILEIGDSFSTFFYGRRLKKLVSSQGGRVVVFVHERLDNFYRQVFHVTGGWLLTRPFRQITAAFLTALLRRRFLATADAVIANSDFSAEEAKRHSSKPVYVLALGIQVDPYLHAQRDDKLYQQLSDGGKRRVIIHVGRLEQDKKIDLLIDFARGLDAKRYSLIIIGDGKFKKTLELFPAVKAIGYLQHDNIIPYLASADLGILVNDIEPFGLVGLEMMATGLPLLAPNRGGLSSFITPDFAWLLPYRAEKYLKALAEWSALSQSKQQALRLAARHEAENYTTDRMGQRLMAIYHKII